MKPHSIVKKGRPTDYKRDLVIPQVQEYLNTTGREQTKLPSIEGLALYLNKSKQTLYNWSELFPEFMDAIKKIELLQKEELINAGFYGGREINASMGIFLLKANHKLSDQSNNINIENKVMIIPSELANKYGLETNVIDVKEEKKIIHKNIDNSKE
jgi:hypothetical protein